jgi:hypothetical protein
MHQSFDHQDLTRRGFVDFQLLRQLPRRCAHVPSGSGIYVVTLEPPVTGYLAERWGPLQGERSDGAGCPARGQAA